MALAPRTNGELLDPLATKIAQLVLEIYTGETPGPISALATKDGDSSRALVLRGEEAALLLLACEHAVRKVMPSWSADPDTASTASVVTSHMAGEKIRAVTKDLDIFGVEDAYFGEEFPTGKPNYELLRERLGELEPVITGPLLANWCIFMSKNFEPFAHAILKSSCEAEEPTQKKTSAGCLLFVAATGAAVGLACKVL
jgi:hypothetical protein